MMELPISKSLTLEKPPSMVPLLLLLVAALLLPSAELQLIYTQVPHPARQLYYEAPRLRRLEYGNQPSAGYMSASYGPNYGPAPTPANYQLINYRPNYQPLPLEQQLPPATLPIYPQPSIQYQQRAIAPHAELAKYRYEGNYIPVQRVPILTQQATQQQRRVEEHLYNVPPALFTSDVLHVVPSRQAPPIQPQTQPSAAVERPRREAEQRIQDANANGDPETAETKTKKETKYYHDIFMRFNGPTSRSHGHVLNHPKAQERRFETQRGTNRYKGEVIWTDRQGSHGEHRWDLAQGKL